MNSAGYQFLNKMGMMIPTLWGYKIMSEYREGAQNSSGHIVNIACVSYYYCYYYYC